MKKTRWLYTLGQVRIHCDRVEGLGDFLELEVGLNDEQVKLHYNVPDVLQMASGILD